MTGWIGPTVTILALHIVDDLSHDHKVNYIATTFCAFNMKTIRMAEIYVF